MRPGTGSREFPRILHIILSSAIEHLRGFADDARTAASWNGFPTVTGRFGSELPFWAAVTPEPRPVPEPCVVDPPALHVQPEAAAGPFRRIAGVVGVLVVAIVVGVLVGVPVLLLGNSWSPWLLRTLVFVAAGLWLAAATVSALRKSSWRASQRSSPALRESGIGTTGWNTVGAESPVRRTIPLEAVEIVPSPSTGGRPESTTGLENRRHQRTATLGEQAEQRDPALRAARPEPAARNWILGSWLAGTYTLGTGCLLVHLLNRGMPPTTG